MLQETSTGITMKGQSEITLADKLDLKDRQGIYRNFLIQSMSGRSHNLRMFSQREALPQYMACRLAAVLMSRCDCFIVTRVLSLTACTSMLSAVHMAQSAHTVWYKAGYRL